MNTNWILKENLLYNIIQALSRANWEIQRVYQRIDENSKNCYHRAGHSKNPKVEVAKNNRLRSNYYIARKFKMFWILEVLRSQTIAECNLSKTKNYQISN